MPIVLTMGVLILLLAVGLILKRKLGKTPEASADVDGGKDGCDANSGDVGPANGPKAFRSRGCTDVFCLLLFIIFWIGMVYIGYLAVTVGEPYSVLYGKDYLGNRCGRGNFTDRPKTLFPRLDQDLITQVDIATTAPWKLVLYGLCVKECPDVADPTICFGEPQRCMVSHPRPSLVSCVRQRVLPRCHARH